jgi:hypothetical protein
VRVTGVPQRRCVRHGFRARVRVADASALKRVLVRVDGRLVRKTKTARFRQRVRAHSLRPGRHRLAVVATDSAGNRARQSLQFIRCA